MTRLLLTLALLLWATTAQASITRGSNEASEFADFNDASHALAYTGASGRLHVCAAIILTSATTFTVPTASNVTFTERGQAFATAITVALWSGVSTGAVGTVTFGMAANDSGAARVWCREYTSSTGWTSHFDAADTDTEASAVTTHPAASAQLQVTAAVNSGGEGLTVGLIGLDRSATSLTTPTGYTLYANIDTGIDLLADRIDASGGTRNFDSTSGAAAVGASLLVSFKEDASGGGGGGGCPGMLLRGVCD